MKENNLIEQINSQTSKHGAEVIAVAERATAVLLMQTDPFGSGALCATEISHQLITSMENMTDGSHIESAEHLIDAVANIPSAESLLDMVSNSDIVDTAEHVINGDFQLAENVDTTESDVLIQTAERIVDLSNSTIAVEVLMEFSKHVKTAEKIIFDN